MKPAQHPLAQLFGYTLAYKARLMFAIICSVMNKLCDIVPEMLIGIAIDVIVNQTHSIIARYTGIVDPFTQICAVGILTAFFWIFESVFEYIYLILWRSLAQEVQHTVRMQTYDHLQHLDMSYFEHKTTGGLLSILNDDINQLEQFLSEAPNAVIQLAVNILVMGLLFTYFSPLLALITVIPIPFVIAIAYYFQNKLTELYGMARAQVEALSSHIASRVTGIATIKSYAAEAHEVARLAEESRLYQRVNNAASRINAAYIPVVRMGVLCGFIGTLILGGWLALTGTLSISSYSMLVFLTQRFLWPFTTVTTITDMYERAMASARRVFDILAQENKIVDGSEVLRNTYKTEQLDTNKIGSIRFDHVAFSYNTARMPIFNDLSLTIPAQHTVGFVGTTGSGKSTLIKLLLRFYDPTAGEIAIDGIDIKTLTQASLRKAIGLVSQEVYLVSGTIADNIAYGSEQVSREQIIAAAKISAAHEFIIRLPDGYDTLLSENGKNLSGGQRQRISIARAIIKRPPILIFDEATSAVDNETEAAIQDSLSRLAHQHTMIIIAHRLSTVKNADIIHVMEHGKIIESGTHDELIHKQGPYAKLWHAQLR